MRVQFLLFSATIRNILFWGVQKQMLLLQMYKGFVSLVSAENLNAINECFACCEILRNICIKASFQKWKKLLHHRLKRYIRHARLPPANSPA